MVAKTNRIWHGTKVFVSPNTPSAFTAAGFNAAAYTAGNNAYAEAGSLINLGGEWGIMRKDAVAEPMDKTAVEVALYDIKDYGTVEITFLRKDDDDGLASFATGAGANAKYTVKLLTARKNTTALPGGHHAEDGAIYLYGYVLAETTSGGSGGDWIQTKIQFRLTNEPLEVDDP